jgi:polysaccharide biosynthesis transport protein
MLQTEKPLANQRADVVDNLVDLIPSPADTFKSVTDFIRRQYPVIAFTTAIAIALGLIYMLTTAPSYTATTSMIIDTHKLQLFGQQSIFNDVPLDTSTVDSQVEILKSENIALAVIKKANLANDPEFVGGGGFIGSVIGAITGLFSSNEADEPTSEFRTRRQAVAAFEKRLTVKRVGLTYVILIKFQAHDPDRAANIANEIAYAYIDDQLGAKYDSARRAGVWLQARLNELRDQASAAESAVVAFKNKNDMVDAGGRTINEQQLAELNSQMLVAQAQTSEARAKLDRVQSVLTSNNPEATVVATVADTLKNEVITKLRTQYLEMAAREGDWAKRYGTDHLAVVNLRNQMRELQNSIRNELQRIAETYKSDLEIATQHEQSLRKQLNETVAQSQVTGQAQVSLRDLVSTAQTYRALYDNFLQRYMESVQQQSFPVTEARVITAATRPLSKSSPKLLLVLGLATLVGSGIGFIAAAWRDFADRVFRTVDQVEQFLQTDCIALVPLLKNDDAESKSGGRAKLKEQIAFGNIGRAIKLASQGRTEEIGWIAQELKTATRGFGTAVAARIGGEKQVVQRKDEIPIGKDPRPRAGLAQTIAARTITSDEATYAEIINSPFSPFAEAIRSVKVAIDQSPTAAGGRIIGVTSSVPNEGKSSIATAVARWLAQTGARTLLVDCDLRNPTLSRSLSAGAAAGLLEVLRNQSSLEKAVWSDPTTGMKFLPVAMKGRMAHSSEVLGSAQTRKYLDSLRTMFDYIILDFSPLMPIVDVRVSTSMVDSYIYVIAWGETRIEFVKKGLNSARGVYERLLGVVLNKVNLTAVDRYDSGAGYYRHTNYARYGYTE